MIKYKATPCYPFIRTVEVVREDQFSAWKEGHRNFKIYGTFCYFDTFQDAKCWLIELTQKKIDRANFLLKQAKGIMGKVKRLEEE